MEQQNAGAPAQRPTLLTVLCILSFIGAGFAIIWYIIALIGAMAAQALVSGSEEAIDAMGATDSAAVADAASDVAAVGMGLVWAYVILGTIGTILALVGVIRMWKLQKSGFYLYVAGTVLALIMSVVFAGTEGLVMNIVVPVVFIVLYGLNLKHMK